jgi:hypothetical protein
MDKTVSSMIFSRGMPVSRKISEKTDKAILFAAVLAVILLTVLVSIVQAQGGAYAFGFYQPWPLNQVRVHRAWLWTGNPPDDKPWTAAPVGMYQNADGSGAIIETGWVKGPPYTVFNKINQYVAYEDVWGGGDTVVLWQDNLAENTWYQMRIAYHKDHGRWEARIAGPGFDKWVWYAPYDLGWHMGGLLAAGSEAAWADTWMNVWGNETDYRLWDGGWHLYNYSFSDTEGDDAHIEPAYDHGYHAWGNN